MWKKWRLFFSSVLISLPSYAIVVDSTTYSPLDQASFDSEYAFMASIRDSIAADDHICGGTIVGNRWVLTAAHCLVTSGLGFQTSNTSSDISSQYDVRAINTLSITVGKFDLENVVTQDIYDVENIVIHPDYYPIHSTATDENGLTILNSTAYQSDLALLRVDRDFPSELVGYLTLGNADSDLELSNLIDPVNGWDAGNRAPNIKVAGWGTGGDSDPAIGESDTELRQTDVSYYPTSLCYERIESDREFPIYIESPTDAQKICSLPTTAIPRGDNIYGNGPCLGDTGGPLLRMSDNSPNVYLVGIISAGPLINSVCSSMKLPTWYTNVSYYSAWIDSYITSTESPTEEITKPDFLLAQEDVGGGGTDTPTDNGDSGDVPSECEDPSKVNIGGEITELGCSDNGDDSGGASDHLLLFSMLLIAWLRRKARHKR